MVSTMTVTASSTVLIRIVRGRRTTLQTALANGATALLEPTRKASTQPESQKRNEPTGVHFRLRSSVFWVRARSIAGQRRLGT
jgi:hypothetical protein